MGFATQLSLLLFHTCPVTDGNRYVSDSAKVVIHRDANLSGRFFVAVAFSKKDTSSAISGWKIWTDSDGLPRSISTVRDTIPEPFEARVRRVSPTDPKQVVLDVSFSLPKARADSTTVKVWVGSGNLRFNLNLKTEVTKASIKDAITTPSTNADWLILRDSLGGFYLYNIYMILNNFQKDSTRIELSRGSGEVDTTFRRTARWGNDCGTARHGGKA